MATHPVPPRPEPIGARQPLSSGQRTLIGCGLGCFGLVAVVGTLLAFTWWWASTPGPQVATEPIVPEDAVAALRIEGLAEDPGFLDLAEAVITDYQEASRRTVEEMKGQVPEVLRWMAAFQNSRGPRVEELERWLPRELTLFVEPAPGTPDGYSVVAAVNLARYPRVLRLVLLGVLGREEGGRRYDYRGHPVRVEDDTAVAFLGSTLLIGNDAQSLEGAIDGVLEAGSPAGDVGASSEGVAALHELASLARRHPGEWDVHGGFENRENVVASLWWDLFAPESRESRSSRPVVEESSPEGSPEIPEDRAEPALDPELEALAAGVEATWLGIDIASADEIEAVIVFRGRDEEVARQWARRVESDLERLRSDTADRGLDLRIDIVIDGRVVDVSLHAHGVRESLRRGMERTVDDTTTAPRRESRSDD